VDKDLEDRLIQRDPILEHESACKDAWGKTDFGNRDILITLELDPKHAQVAEANLQMSSLLDKHPNLPHMTIGRFADSENLRKALEELRDFHEQFEDWVDTVSVEIIAPDESSILEMTIPIGE